MEEFYFIVLILFLFDSLVWIKNDSYGLYSYFGYNFKVIKEGVRLLNFLPTSQYFSLKKPQFILAQDGIFILKNIKSFKNKYLIDSDFIFLPYKDINNLQIENDSLIINSNYQIVNQSKQALEKLYDSIYLIVTSKSKNTGILVKGYYTEVLIKQHYIKFEDITSIKSQAKNFEKALFFLEPFGLMFSLLFFILLPLSIFNIFLLKISLFNLFLILGVIHLFVVMIILYLYFKKYFKYFDLSYIIPILLYPLSSSHISSNFFRYIYYIYDPLMVMSVFLNKDNFIKAARNEYNQNIMAIELSTDNNYINHFKVKNKKIETLFLEKNIALEKLTLNPKKSDQSSLSFCPLCEYQYLIKEGSCMDCKVPLKPY